MGKGNTGKGVQKDNEVGWKVKRFARGRPDDKTDKR